MEAIWIERVILLVVGFAVGAAVTVVWMGLLRRRRAALGPGAGTAGERERLDVAEGEGGDASGTTEVRPPPVEEIYIRHLGDDEVRDFRARWLAIQRVFVDEPARALDLGHDLLDELIGSLGYPSSAVEEQIQMLSVHHWDSISDYRAAHELYEARREGKATTEDLRQALLHYRELFADLLDRDRRDAQGRVQPERHTFH